MTAPSHDLGVIVVSWNVRALLDTCLSSLDEALRATGTQAAVWVVDNASRDGSPDMVRKHHPEVHLKALDENIGYVKANNLAMATLQHQARYLWLLNPDTVVNAAALSQLIAFLDTHPRAGLVGPKLLNADGSLQESAFRFPGLPQALFALDMLPQRFYYTRLNGRYAPALYKASVPFPIDHPLGAAMMARSETVREVGLLDQGFFMYCEEIDWAWRMEEAGWERWLVPHAEILHHAGASSSQARPQTTVHLWESRARLYGKHCSRLTQLLVRWAVQRFFAQRLHALNDHGSGSKEADAEAWAAAYLRILGAWGATP